MSHKYNDIEWPSNILIWGCLVWMSVLSIYLVRRAWHLFDSICAKPKGHMFPKLKSG